MKKTLTISASVLLLLMGCSTDTEKNTEKKHSTAASEKQYSEEEVLLKLAEETTHFSLNHFDKEHLKIAYPGTDYYNWAKYLVENGTDMLGEEIGTKVIGFEEIVRENDRLMAKVTEQADIPSQYTDYSVTVEYYFFKKHNREWKIYGVSLYDAQLADLTEKSKNEIWAEMAKSDS
ncbi:hypothetical protein MZM54_00170 [[Brevibacterium] frigoritolerans]|nr:hypothetical protein [Peribacillus frigoritolerans]